MIFCWMTTYVSARVKVVQELKIGEKVLFLEWLGGICAQNALKIALFIVLGLLYLLV